MKEALDYCIKNGITISQYALLYLLSTQSEEYALSYVRTVGKFKIDDLKELEYNGYLYPFNEKSVTFNSLKLTSKLKILEISNTFLEDLSKLFVEIFPKGIKSGGYYVKTSYKSCTKKLKKFMEDYPEFTPEVILQATRDYVEDMSTRGYDKMRLAPYFIEKDGISTLWTYCDRIVNPEDTLNEDDPWKIKV